MTDTKPTLSQREINAGALALAKVLRVDQSLPHGWAFHSVFDKYDVRHCHFVRGEAVVAVDFELTNDLQTTVRYYTSSLDTPAIYSFAEMWLEMGDVDQQVWTMPNLRKRVKIYGAIERQFQPEASK